ncbi:hypothetical protein [Sagittula sp. SSi028]|uniref:hypothetical protein n=1 Tax=Sagittula sp. SSi028 TaxID=3400636 RepID=UPI003AF6DBD4
MLGFLRFSVLAFALSTLTFLVLWFHFRIRRRRLIQKAWKEDHSHRKLQVYLAEEHARWDRIRRRNLIVLVYVLPLCLVTTIIYLTNFH